MLGDTKKQLILDGYKPSQMALVEERDRNGKKHYFVVADMEEAKKICGSNNKRVIQVFTKPEQAHFAPMKEMCAFDEAFTCYEMWTETNNCAGCKEDCPNAY